MDGAENHFLAQLKYATLHTCLRVSDQDRDPPNKNWLAPPMNALLSHLKNIPHPPQHTSLILYSMKKITLYIQQSVSWSRFLRPCNATSEEENATGEEMVGGGARNGEAKKGGGGGGECVKDGGGLALGACFIASAEIECWLSPSSISFTPFRNQHAATYASWLGTGCAFCGATDCI